MNKLDRLSLLDTIGRELQSRMSFSDIRTYFERHGVNIQRPWSETNSKWVYAKEMLADATDELVGAIATELEIDYAMSATKNADSRFWTPGFLRVFISHVSAHKVTASNLQNALRSYAVSSFVAHEDIEPTKEWLTEIGKALFSMDALIAILTPDFSESRWTDHEVGIAVGREVLVLPIRKKQDPYGFIGKFQGLQSKGKSVNQVAEEVYQILMQNPKTSDELFGCLIRQLLASNKKDDAKHWLDLLLAEEEVPRTHLEKLQSSISTNEFVMNDTETHLALSRLLERQGLSTPVPASVWEDSDEVPF